ncbi:MAG: helix-turn-helix domain-containing protein, partial [Rhodanobacter sp.]
MQDVTMTAMAQMLRLHKGNVSAAARALGVSRNLHFVDASEEFLARLEGLVDPERALKWQLDLATATDP